VDADDVHRLVTLPDGVSPNAMGAAFNGLLRAGLIEPVGFARSVRASHHSNVFRVWRVAGHRVAMAYLEALRRTEDAHETI
jgi:hypothetical protein